MPAVLAWDDLHTGLLVPVLPQITLLRTSVVLVQRAQKHVPSRVGAFRDLLVEMLRQRPLSRHEGASLGS
jgi:DNA-binding transcriptional LysR family regulator